MPALSLVGAPGTDYAGEPIATASVNLVGWSRRSSGRSKRIYPSCANTSPPTTNFMSNTPKARKRTTAAAKAARVPNQPKFSRDVTFDLKAVFEQDIAPIVEQLQAKLIEHKLPALVAICHTNNKENTAGLYLRVAHAGWLPPDFRSADAYLDTKSTSPLGHLPPFLRALAQSAMGVGADVRIVKHDR